MRTLTSAADAATSATVTRPLHLIEIGFSPISRFSTLGDVTWDGYVWSGGERVEVSGIGADGTGRQTGTVQISNLDGALGALVLNQGVADRGIRIWSGDAAALAADDMRLVLDGVISHADIDVQRVSLALASDGSQAAYVPRRVIGPETGFNYLMPAGTQLRIGTTTYTLERN